MALFTGSWTTDILSIFIMFIVTLYFYMTRNFNHWKKKGIAYRTPIPFLGTFKDLLLFRVSPGEYLANMYNETKEDYYGIFALDQPYLILRSPEVIKNILVKDFNYFSDRTVGDNHRDDPAGTYNLFTIKNPEWRQLRTKLTPIFSSAKLKQMLGLMYENGCELVDYLSSVASKKEVIEAKDVCARYTTDIITNCVFGLRTHSITDENEPFRVAGKKNLTFNYRRALQFFAYFFLPQFVKPLRFKFFDGEATNMLRTMFNDSMDQRKKSGIIRNDLIDALLEIKESYSLEEDKLLAQCIVFLTAGYESSSSVISFTLFEMCWYPEVQEKCRQEIKTVLSKYNGEISYEAVGEMTYLDMVVSETIRKYPPLPFLDRRCMSDYKIPGTNIIIEKGTPVCVPLLGLHYDPNYFPDPQKYDPERFSEQNKKNLVPGTYLPFGAGPRNCIGERFGKISSKLGLIRILSNFEVQRNDKTPITLRIDPKSFLYTSQEGLLMNFKKLGIPAA